MERSIELVPNLWSGLPPDRFDARSFDTLLRDSGTRRAPSMSEHRNSPAQFTRRALLKGLEYAPVLWVPAPLRALISRKSLPPFALAEIPVTPHYPAGSPLDDMLRLVRS